MRVVAGGAYGLPVALLMMVGVGWIAGISFGWRTVWSNPLARVCMIGPFIGISLFFYGSPFPEVRFLLPVFLLLFACFASCVERVFMGRKAGAVIAGILLMLSVATVFDWKLWMVTARFAGLSITIAASGAVCVWWAGHRRLRWIGIWALIGGAAFIFAYINWGAYSRNDADDFAFDIQYPLLSPLWRSFNATVPATATVAYTNLYLLYPLQENAPMRRLVYIPTRPGVSSIADLGWLGDHLSGEKLVPAAVAATIRFPDRELWTKRLQQSGAEYLLIGRGGVGGIPPEADFAAGDAKNFELLNHEQGGWLYRIRPARASVSTK